MKQNPRIVSKDIPELMSIRYLLHEDLSRRQLGDYCRSGLLTGVEAEDLEECFP
jgi:hypothetical protein